MAVVSTFAARPLDRVSAGLRAGVSTGAPGRETKANLLTTIAERAAGRTVVLTGDIHSNWVNDVKQGFDRPDRPVVATEFVGTSISSGGDGIDEWPQLARARSENSHVKWQNARRGYVRCDVTDREWRAECRTVPFVTCPGAPVETPTRWRLAHGRAGVERT